MSAPQPNGQYAQPPYDPNTPLVSNGGYSESYNGASGYQPPQQYNQYPPNGAPQQQAPYGGTYVPPPQGYVAAPVQQAYPYGAPGAPAQTDGMPMVIPTFRKIMTEDFCGCFDDFTSFAFACCLPACLAGNNYELTGQGSCLIGCFCYPFMSGCYRSGVQRALGVADQSCLLNCCIHLYLRPCALSQEARAIKEWVNVGRPAAIPGQIVM